MQSEDFNRLSSAIVAAEKQGVAGLNQARERLRYLQAKLGASRELHDAQQSSDIYRLRAALASANSAGLPSGEMQKGRDALRTLEAVARVRNTIQTAIAQRNGEILCQALAEAKQLPLTKKELAKAEVELRNLGQCRQSQDLQEAIASGDAELLRQKAAAAAASGVDGALVAKAWEKLREFEAQAWLRRQLNEAAARADPLRLQTAVRQAEAGGLVGADLDAARAKLMSLSARLHALQELRLARSSGNPYGVQTAIRECERAGLTKAEMESAMRESDAAVTIVPQTRLQTDMPALTTNPQLMPTELHLTTSSVVTNPQLWSEVTAPRTRLPSGYAQAPNTVITDAHACGEASSPEYVSWSTQSRHSRTVAQTADAAAEGQKARHVWL